MRAIVERTRRTLIAWRDADVNDFGQRAEAVLSLISLLGSEAGNG